MLKHLDTIDVQILEGLAQHGPRNISKVSEELGIPRGTVLSRINHMTSSFYLRLVTTIYHTNLGMKKAVVFAKATPGQEDALFNYLRINKFYIYLTRCFGTFEGCLGIYIIPIEHTTEFEDFLNEVKKLGVTTDIELHWSTCFHTVNRTRKWFDEDKQEYVFPWDKWLEEVFTSDSELPYTLKDPESFTLKADETDIFIVKELEKDATVTLAALARAYETTLQNIRYHYQTHAIGHGLIETFQISIFPFDRATSDMIFFILKFDDKEKMAKFAHSFLDKPFVFILGKILKENTLVSQVYLPRQEFRNFTDTLSKLVRMNFLQTYHYVIQDLRPGKWSRETIPHQLFKNGEWTYNHSEHLKTLRELASNIKATASFEPTHNADYPKTR